MLGQPNVDISVDRAQADRFGINVADVQDAIQTAVGGNPVSQILIGDQRFDLVPRYQPQFRTTIDQIKNIRLLAPSGERVSLGQLCKISVDDGASMIYREGNQRYIAIKYSVRGRDLGSTVEEAMNKVNREVKLPPGYTLDWAGEYESQKRANHRLATVIPITILVIVLVLYSMFRSFKWSFLVLLNLTLGAHRRSGRPADYRNSLQRFHRRRLSGAVRSVGADRRHHGGAHQPAARARAGHQ